MSSHFEERERFHALKEYNVDISEQPEYNSLEDPKEKTFSVSLECIIRHHKELHGRIPEEIGFWSGFLLFLLFTSIASGIKSCVHVTIMLNVHHFIQDLALWDPESRKHMDLFMGMLLNSCKCTR